MLRTLPSTRAASPLMSYVECEIDPELLEPGNKNLQTTPALGHLDHVRAHRPLISVILFTVLAVLERYSIRPFPGRRNRCQNTV